MCVVCESARDARGGNVSYLDGLDGGAAPRSEVWSKPEGKAERRAEAVVCRFGDGMGLVECCKAAQIEAHIHSHWGLAWARVRSAVTPVERRKRRQ